MDTTKPSEGNAQGTWRERDHRDERLDREEKGVDLAGAIQIVYKKIFIVLPAGEYTPGELQGIIKTFEAQPGAVVNCLSQKVIYTCPT